MIAEFGTHYCHTVENKRMKAMAIKKRVFISYDCSYDLGSMIALSGEAKLYDSPFSICGVSIKHAVSSYWKYYVEQSIRSCDVVIVICGSRTDAASGVSAELAIAKEEGIPYFLLTGIYEGLIKKPRGVNLADKVYNLTSENLRILINSIK